MQERRCDLATSIHVADLPGGTAAHPKRDELDGQGGLSPDDPLVRRGLVASQPKRAHQTKVPTDSDGNMVWKNVS